jgi:uncharacterized protein (DUF1778 family)
VPRAAIENNSRMSVRIKPADKAVIMRASAISGADMTEFVVRTAVQAARELIDQSERIALSERDSLKLLAALENPPKPNAKLVAAVRSLPPLK